MIWQLIGLFSGEYSEMQMAYLLAQLTARVFVIIFCLSVHEFAHGFAAKKLGDDTAWMHGRLTLNPAKHLDLIGTLMIFVVGFGYAKPVPVNPRNFKSYKKGMAITAAAGPLSNLLLALLFFGVSKLLLLALGVPNQYVLLLAETPNLYGYILYTFVSEVAGRNVALAIFNLLPIPPLDGSRILDLFLPARASEFIERNERWFQYGLYAVLFIIFMSSR
jgi:Zn-dependent protease